MLSGFNTNYRYRGVLFHVQTEDSGVSNPHVITHLVHGGNILASEKLDYAKSLDAKDLEDVVRDLMESQHKAMLKRLKRGGFDAVIRERVATSAFADSTASADTMSELSPSDSEAERPDKPPGAGPNWADGLARLGISRTSKASSTIALRCGGCLHEQPAKHRARHARTAAVDVRPHSRGPHLPANRGLFT